MRETSIIAKQTCWEDLSITTSDLDTLKHWVEAYTAWLEDLQTNYSQNVWKDAQHAWEEFIAYVRRPPWEIEPVKIEEYKTLLFDRGLKSSTISLRLLNLRRFYDFCLQRRVDEDVERGENPLNLLEWPKVVFYEKPTYPKIADERRLLRTIQEEPFSECRNPYML